jgi:RHH-type transcriptional regulator, rel operon repressor / antitoxin RelB
MMQTTTVSVRVPRALKQRLAKLAAATARSSSWLAARALEDYVESQEWQIATIQKGKRDLQAGRTIPHDRVARWLRTWGTRGEKQAP